MTRYQVGGAVRPGAVYVTRPADHLLPEALLRGELCQVLAPRQMGKSSLRMRVSERLAQEGYRTATVDLSGLGTAGVTPDAWFAGLCGELATELDVPEPVLPPGAPLHGWTRFLGDLVDADPEPLVVFFDEIDIVRRLPFGGADLLGGIRAVYERRAHDPRWRRLMVCVVGAATPDALSAASGGAPFNVGTRIELRDFTRLEAATLADGLPDPTLLETVYQWTAGHPYMTLRLCEELAREGTDETPPAPRVAELVRRLFLDGGPSGDVNLAAAGREILFDDDLAHARLDLYARARIAPVPRDAAPPGLVDALELSGMIAERQGKLEPRNRIVAEVFDAAWITRQLAGRPIQAAMRPWRAGGERPADLPRGPALRDLREWAAPRSDLSPDEARFLLLAAQAEMTTTAAEAQRRRVEERREAAERLARVRGRLLVVIAVAGLLLLGAVLRLAGALREAEAAAARATTEARTSTQLRLAAEASAAADLPRSAEAALGLAVEAVGEADPDEVPAAVTRALADGLSAASGWTLRGHGAPVTGVACPGDGTVLSRDTTGETRAWSTADGHLLQVWRPGDTAAPAVGPGLAARVAALQAVTGETGPIRRVDGPEGSVRWSPERYAGTLTDPTGAVRATLSGPAQPGIVWGAFTRFGLLTMSPDDTLWRWSPTDGRAVARFQLLGWGPADVEVCPDGLHLVASATDGGLAVWKVVGGAARLAIPEPEVYRVAWTDDGIWVGTYPDGDWVPGDPRWFGRVRRDPRTGARVDAVGTPPAFPWEASPTGEPIADGDPSTLYTRTGAVLRVLDGALDHTPVCGRWSADGSRLAGGNQDGTTSLWDADGRLVRLLGGPGPAATCPAFSPDGRRLLVGHRDAPSVLYDVASGGVLRTLDKQAGTVREAAWSPDGSRFATAGFDGSVGVWTAEGALLHLLHGHASLVRTVTFSADGRRLASAGDDLAVHVWDLDRAELVAALRGHGDVIRSLAFSPDGEEIVSSGDDGFVLVFPASPRALVAAAKAAVRDR